MLSSFTIVLSFSLFRIWCSLFFATDLLSGFGICCDILAEREELVGDGDGGTDDEQDDDELPNKQSSSA